MKLYDFEIRSNDKSIEPDDIIEAISWAEAYEEWVEKHFGNGSAPYCVWITCDFLNVSEYR